jgi:hypothetical protein
MIPMMILSGAMFSFDKLNRSVGSVDKVPLIAEIMPTKWSYEALMVHQYKDNAYEQAKVGPKMVLFDLEKQESEADYMQVYFIPRLQEKAEAMIKEYGTLGKLNYTSSNLQILKNEIAEQLVKVLAVKFNNIEKLSPASFSEEIVNSLKSYLNELKQYYTDEFNKVNKQKENVIRYWMSKDAQKYKQIRDDYYNESISDYVRKSLEKNKILEYKNRLVQQYDPIYADPGLSGFFNFRAHLFAPRKHFMGQYFDTFRFNMSVVWMFTLFLYIALYFELLKKLLNLPEYLRKKKIKNKS